MALSVAQIDEVKARADLPDLARSLGARLRAGSGGRMLGSCPICGGGQRASRFEIKRKGPDQIWVCAVCNAGGDAIALVRKVTGCDFAAAIERLGGPRPLSPDEERRIAAERARREAEAAAQAEQFRLRERAACARLWEGGVAPTRERLGRYFAARGLLLPASALIREADGVPYFHGAEAGGRDRSGARLLHRGPAMLALLTGNDGAPTGLHITWLADDWTGKAEVHDPDTGEVLPAKKMRGSKLGAKIVVRDYSPRAAAAGQPGGAGPLRLFIGEGIETVAAVGAGLKRAGRLLPGDLFWAAGDLGNLGGPHAATVAHPTAKSPAGLPQRVPGPEPKDGSAIAIPPNVGQLVLLGDGDSEPVLTAHALERARRRALAARARERAADAHVPPLVAVVLMAPRGQDFNDVVRGAG